MLCEAPPVSQETRARSSQCHVMLNVYSKSPKFHNKPQWMGSTFPAQLGRSFPTGALETNHQTNYQGTSSYENNQIRFERPTPTSIPNPTFTRTPSCITGRVGCAINRSIRKVIQQDYYAAVPIKVLLMFVHAQLAMSLKLQTCFSETRPLPGLQRSGNKCWASVGCVCCISSLIALMFTACSTSTPMPWIPLVYITTRRPCSSKPGDPDEP